jgi:micrococcal nuclease
VKWAVVAGGLIVALAACTAPGRDEPAGSAVVEHVVDGDTIDVRIGGRLERVRLIGIDTPETKKPNSPIECFGPEASAFTTSLLPVGTPVRIERDVVGRDDYGRLLGYVYVGDHAGRRGELFVNEEIIRRGYATPLSIEPNTTFARTFAAAARDAEADDMGLWASCSP